MNNTTLPDDAMYLIKRRDDLAARLWKDAASAEFVTLKKGFLMQPPPDAQPTTLIRGVATGLSVSSLVTWRDDLLQCACAQHESFVGANIVKDCLPRAGQWWPANGSETPMLSEVRPIFERQKSDQPLRWFKGVYLEPGNEIFGAFFIFSNDKHLLLYFADLDKVECRHPFANGLSPILAGLDFMAQDFTEQTTHRAPARFGLNKQKYVPVVRTVQLRARPKAEPSAASNLPREYEHSWMVTGHRRRLAQPRRADGAQVVWVRPYVKGDPSKPLLTPRETIIKVAR